MAKTDGTDRVHELHERLERQVSELVSGEDWAKMLEVASRFHRYSVGNVLLILAQRPDSGQVAGYQTWRSLGRQVRKGETGIQIFAPCGGSCRACDGTGHHPTDKTLTCGRCFGSGRWQSFRVAYVFDVAQTDGEPLPAEVRPVLLDGAAPVGLWSRLASLVADEGFDLERGDCAGANGLTNFTARTVRVRDDVADAQACKTLAHELAHVLLHESVDYAGCRGRWEIEAESVAFIVTAALGLDSGTYTLPYVARWAGGDLSIVRATAERVMEVAHRILARLDAAELVDVEHFAAVA